jgi:hypothetical protein
MTIFYVYEHWRLDRDECFYVGKGHGGRAYNMSRRNKHHEAIRAKVHREGFAIEVRIVASNLSEEDAYNLEVERIAFWREAGVDLANMSVGGKGGAKGLTPWIKGRKHSEETIKKMAQASREMAKNRPEEYWKKNKEKLSSKEHREFLSPIISEANKNRVWSLESREKVASSLRGRKASEEARKNMSLSQRGKPKSEAHKAAISKAKRASKVEV